MCYWFQLSWLLSHQQRDDLEVAAIAIRKITDFHRCNVTIVLDCFPPTGLPRQLRFLAMTRKDGNFCHWLVLDCYHYTHACACFIYCST